MPGSAWSAWSAIPACLSLTVHIPLLILQLLRGCFDVDLSWTSGWGGNVVASADSREAGDCLSQLNKCSRKSMFLWFCIGRWKCTSQASFLSRVDLWFPASFFFVSNVASQLSWRLSTCWSKPFLLWKQRKIVRPGWPRGVWLEMSIVRNVELLRCICIRQLRKFENWARVWFLASCHWPSTDCPGWRGRADPSMCRFVAGKEIYVRAGKPMESQSSIDAHPLMLRRHADMRRLWKLPNMQSRVRMLSLTIWRWGFCFQSAKSGVFESWCPREKQERFRDPSSNREK